MKAVTHLGYEDVGAETSGLLCRQLCMNHRNQRFSEFPPPFSLKLKPSVWGLHDSVNLATETNDPEVQSGHYSPRNIEKGIKQS